MIFIDYERLRSGLWHYHEIELGKAEDCAALRLKRGDVSVLVSIREIAIFLDVGPAGDTTDTDKAFYFCLGLFVGFEQAAKAKLVAA